MKKRIVFFMANLHGGGAERVTSNIIKGLDPEVYDIILLLVKKEGVFLKEIPSYVKVVDLDVKKTIFSWYKVRKVLKMVKPDIVYSTMFHTSIVLTLALLGLKQKPLVVLRNPTSPKLLFEENGLSFTWKILLKYSYKKADRILAQTPEMKQEIEEYYGIDPESIDVFLNPLDTDMIDQMSKEGDNPFDTERINVVSAGRLSYAKAFDTLLYSFAKVVEKDQRFILHIIGKDDGEEEDLLRLMKELNLTKNVKFWGFQENPYRFYIHADLYVLSSRREGLPNTVLENLYLKKPVVATKCIPFLESLIINGENGFLVNVDDIEALASAIVKCKNLSSQSQETSFISTNSDKFFDSIIGMEN